MWRYSTEINKGAGTTTSWDAPVSYKISSSQLRKDPIKVKVLNAGKVVGHGDVTCLSLLLKHGDYIKLKCELTKDGQPAGYVILNSRFVPDAAKASPLEASRVGDRLAPDETEQAQKVFSPKNCFQNCYMA